jgi:GGDEF domain-containing protein
MANPFYKEGSKLLAPDAFDFVLERELKRACRSLNFLTLVVFEASREGDPSGRWDKMMSTADQATMQEVARIIEREVRNNDLLGDIEPGVVSVVLLDADLEHSTRVIDRLIAGIDGYEFQTPLRIAVGAACYPTDAVDASSLKRHAMSRPIAQWRGGGPRAQSAEHN